jgi:nucleoside-diphosphate-sugar epimerase
MIRHHVGPVLAAHGKPAVLPQPLHGPARAGDLRSNLVDAALAGDVLGWQPSVLLDDGLRQTAAWFAERRMLKSV